MSPTDVRPVAADARRLSRDRPWPLQPLLDACGISRTALARRVGVSGSTIVAAGERGLTDAQADEWAIALGTHPLMVWGWAWIDAADQSSGRPAHVRLAALVREAIESGELRPGQSLPLHALTERWNVAAKTAARALDELRAEGLVVGGVGRGTTATIAAGLATGAVDCSVCGRPIEPADEHYPHRPHCTMAARGWCECDQAAHPECCPSCAAGVTA